MVLPVFGVVNGEQAALMVFVGEGLNHANTADVFFNAGVECPDLPELFAHSSGHSGPIAGGNPCHGRNHKAGQKRKIWVQTKHQTERAQKRHHSDKGIFRPVMGDFADLLQILGDTGDQVPGFGVVVEAEREFLQMVKDAAAHFGFNGNA